jgi:hypothetical protein
MTILVTCLLSSALASLRAQTTVPAETLRAELASGDPRRVAFAAVEVAQRHDASLREELLEALRAGDERREQLDLPHVWLDGVHRDREAEEEKEDVARADLLHALVQIDARLIAGELFEFAKRGTTYELVILACRSRPWSDPFLEQIVAKGADLEWWIAAYNALHGGRDDDWVEEALSRVQIHVAVKVAERFHRGFA